MALNKLQKTTLARLIDDLYWEYDRMSSSGKETLDKLAGKVGLTGPDAEKILRGEND